MRRICLIGLLFIFGAVPIFAADLTVAADGSGDVKTVSEAIERVPENNKKRFTIFIKKGVYREQVRIPASKPFITLIGESAETTVLSFDINSERAGSTSAAYAFYVGGHDFRAENLTFENSFDFEPGLTGSQAVAVLADADRVVFKNCRFLGWQDTLYAKNGRQYYENCYVEGHVDFIFGQAAAVFENCTIHSKADGYIAAPMRFAADEPSGFVFIGSKLTGANTARGVFLGRPWRAYGRTVFIDTEMGAHIRAEGWNNWGSADNEKTAFFAEYASRGAGGRMSGRVSWMRHLTKEEADRFRPENFLKGKDEWNPKKAADDALEKTAPEWKPVSWGEVFDQNPLWYQTDEASRIADQIVWFQKENGGWEKNLDMARMLTESEKEKLVRDRANVSATTIDNRATYTQLRFLGRMITESAKKKTPPANFPRYIEAFEKGLDYLFAAQYETGGFPQFYPLRKGYYTHITFNDNAMIGVLRLFRDVAKKKEDFRFVDEPRRVKAEKALEKAVPLILKLQVTVGGKKTVWAAQYDENTLRPAAARAFEPASLTAGESVGIVRFLMLDANPSKEKIDAVEAAVRWYRENKIDGFRWISARAGTGLKHSLVKDQTAPPIWARFYEIETMKPIFIGRDARIKYSVSEIEPERQDGYAWYVSAPRELLEKDYPRWKEKIGKR